MREPWIKWTVMEAGTKTVTKVLQQVVGLASGTIGSTFYATGIIGALQAVVGWTFALRLNVAIIPSGWGVVRSVLFGASAALSRLLSFSVFLYGGEIGTNTFLILLSIVPGALIDRFYYKQVIAPIQWAGIAVFLFAGYAILDFPTLSEVGMLPLWVWLSLATMFLTAGNQWLTQAMAGRGGDVNKYVNNFWGGLTNAVVGISGVVLLGAGPEIAGNPEFLKITGLSLFFSSFVIMMWNLNFMAYEGGAYISFKKLVLNSSYLTMAMVVGVIFFGEAITFGKILGVVLFLVAFSMQDRGTWKFVRETFST